MWTLGSGSITGFSQNGSTSENWRIQGVDHVGQETILWEARNDASSGPDGGWNSSYKPITNTNTYRFSVWIKKTNSNDGRTYFGCRRTNGILRLNGSINNNPYFWSGDLPQLDRWYLLVGYVHNKNYSGQTNQGAIYDGVTGEQITNINILDYKFSSSATSVQHRAYLYYDTNIDDRQYFMKPRLEKVDGIEPSINELLNISLDSNLTFNFDSAGNQTSRLYCASGICSRSIEDQTKEAGLIEEDSTVDLEENDDSEESLESIEIRVFPNPTSGLITISFSERIIGDYSIAVYDLNGRSILTQNFHYSKSKSSVNIDISNRPSGTYLVHIHSESGEFLTQKIIKN